MSRLPARVAPALLAIALLVPAAYAQQDDTRVETPAPPETPLTEPQEYGGIVTDQSVTSLGHEFARRFSESWSRQSRADGYVLSIRERSSPRYGTEVLVVQDDDVMFRNVLPRSFWAVSALAENAAELVANRLAELAIQQLLFENADLAKTPY